MVLQVGCDYVLSGHSERRSIFGDSDEDVNAKTLKIIKQGMKCILCIGELKEVPKDHPDTGVECGFYGIPSRAYRNQFGMAEYARVELP